LQRMKADGVEPNTVTYSTLIFALGKGGQLARAFDVLDDMEAAGCTPNVVTYASLIEACANRGQCFRAEKVHGDGQVANRDGRGFGWEIAHGVVTRRPPISLDTIVRRTGSYAYDSKVWDLSIIQGPSLSPRANSTSRFATVCIAEPRPAPC
jgi:pentatricopeptide repeat protein